MTETKNQGQIKVAVDAVLFCIKNQSLNALLIQIAQGPYKDKWCLPGGLVEAEESLEEAVTRIGFEKANISNVYMEQLYTFGDPNRDVRSRSISVAYFALINEKTGYKVKTTPYYAKIEWIEINKLPELAFDHKKIIEAAYQRLKAKIGYSNIVYSLLEKEFTLSQLQEIYEIILGKELDKRNFRKKMLALNLVTEVKNKLHGQHRPAQLYRFRQNSIVFT